MPDDGVLPGDDDSPDLGGTGSGSVLLAPGTSDYPGGPTPDLLSDGIELQYGPGGFPPHYPGGGVMAPMRVNPLQR